MICVNKCVTRIYVCNTSNTSNTDGKWKISHGKLTRYMENYENRSALLTRYMENDHEQYEM
jgi:hypothetical protein